MNDESTDQVFNVGSDLPQTDPANDAFGYAPFAKKIADVIQKTPSPQGLVMAIDGEWGSGKSSVLNFIKYYLTGLPNDQKPIIIDFNPWWFKDSDDLAVQFLNTFGSQLGKENKTIKKIRDLLADYSDAIGQVAAILDPSGKVLTNVLRNLRSKTKSIPLLKKELSKVLTELNQRILFIVDDIDRLSPNEIRELFKVIKALADFPNTIYILSFDRRVVSDSLSSSLGVNGDVYLEKIVQVQFSLPSVNRYKLRNAVIENINRVINIDNSLEIDQNYWSDVYFSGLEYYIKKPRDVVRFSNGIGVLYSSVVGEVNPVDFIAIEFIKIFEPKLYATIKDNKEHFIGDKTNEKDKVLEKKFHNEWLQLIPSSRRDKVKNIMQLIFPKISNAIEDDEYNRVFFSQNTNVNRKAARICNRNSFDVYFEYSVPDDIVGNFEINLLLSSDATIIKDILINSSKIRRPSGGFKVDEYLEFIREIEDFALNSIVNITNSLFDIGDILVLENEDFLHGFPGMRYRRLLWTIDHLLKKLPSGQRLQLLINAINKAKALSFISHVVRNIHDSQKDNQHELLSYFNEDEYATLSKHLINRVANLDEANLFNMSRLLKFIWNITEVGGLSIVKERLSPLFKHQENFPAVIEKFVTYSYREIGGESSITPVIKPSYFDDLIEKDKLKQYCENSLINKDITESQRNLLTFLLEGIKRVEQGKNPDPFFD